MRVKRGRGGGEPSGDISQASTPAALLDGLLAHTAARGWSIVDRAQALKVGPFLQDRLGVLKVRAQAGED